MKLRFDDFVFDPETGELWQGSASVALQPQPARVLAILIHQPGQLVTRAAIQSQLWGENTHVDFEQGLNWSIRRIREVLGDSPSSSRYIQTVPRRGYRFLAELRESAPLPNQNSVEPWWKSRRVAIPATVLALALICSGFVLGGSPHHTVTILVLPFDNLSGSQAGSNYEDIASNELMAELARLNPKRLSVIDPLTAKKFKNTKECIIKIGNQLGADYVLLGDVEPSATTVKVDAQLFKVSTNRQVWAAERQIPRNGEFSPVWHEMSLAIAAELQPGSAIKN